MRTAGRHERVRDLRFALPVGYALLLVPDTGPPFLATGFGSRAEFLAAFNAGDTPADWRRVTRSYRMALEIQTPRDALRALDTARCVLPEQLEPSERLVFAWLRKTSISHRRVRAPGRSCSSPGRPRHPEPGC